MAKIRFISKYQFQPFNPLYCLVCFLTFTLFRTFKKNSELYQASP